MAMQTTPPERRALLNLDTFAVRDFVVIDGTAYDLRHPDELSPRDRQWVSFALPRMHAIEAKEEYTDEESADYSSILDRMIRHALDAPPEVLAKLNTGQKIRVTASFIVPLLAAAKAKLTRATTDAPAGRSTGAKQRHGSRGSTAARRTSG